MARVKVTLLRDTTESCCCCCCSAQLNIVKIGYNDKVYRLKKVKQANENKINNNSNKNRIVWGGGGEEGEVYE